LGKKRGRRHREEEEEFGRGYGSSRGHGRQDDEQVKPRKSSQIVVSARTQGQKQYILDIMNHDITVCTGPAGCGKTIIPTGLALQGLLAPNPAYEKIIILRPAKEACGERIGFLPGDMGEKMAPWAAPLVDNMSVFIEQSKIKELFYHKAVEVIPLAYARGRSLNDAFIILDEAQNCTKEQLLMALTRIGQNSKMVINGDLDQDDHPTGGSGLLDAMQRLTDMEGVAITQLTDGDIVRNPLIAEIIRRYKKDKIALS
jgi:phosphate starvation-inducible protein PhoH and related proteins